MNFGGLLRESALLNLTSKPHKANILALFQHR